MEYLFSLLDKGKLEKFSNEISIHFAYYGKEGFFLKQDSLYYNVYVKIIKDDEPLIIKVSAVVLFFDNDCIAIPENPKYEAAIGGLLSAVFSKLYNTLDFGKDINNGWF